MKNINISEKLFIENLSGLNYNFLNARYNNLSIDNLFVQSDVVNIKDYGGGIGNDDAAILRSLVKSNRTVIMPSGDYYFKSVVFASGGDQAMSWYCVEMNGISNFQIIGEDRTRIIITNDIYNTIYSAYGVFLYHNSADKFNEGLFCEYNRLSNLIIILIKPKINELTTGINCINLTSASFCEIDRCTFDGRTNDIYAMWAITGTGAFGHDIHNNIFLDCNVCTDNSQYWCCTFRENKCICNSGYGPIPGGSTGWLGGLTAFNHFYDGITISNIRLSVPLPYTISAFNSYENNIIQGYINAFALRDIIWTDIIDNMIYNTIQNGNVESNIITIYNNYIPSGTGFINILNNIIYNCYNEKATNRGISITSTCDNCIVNFNKIYNNQIDKKLTVGIRIANTTSNIQVFGNEVFNGTTTPSSNISINTIDINFPILQGENSQITTTSGNLFLNPSGSNLVKFGTYNSTSVPVINGFITIKDKNGNTRKLATIT